jgi:hypothetical protein
MSKFVFNLLVIVLFALQGQAQLNSYKYIIVPRKFEGFKKENQFRTSTQIKHLFSQYGFSTLYEDQYPPDLAEEPCLGLRVLLLDNSSLLATRVRLGLRDCNGAVVYESVEGKSKSKDYELAYREAIDEAFLSIPELGYSYTPAEAASKPAQDREAVVAASVPPPAEPLAPAVEGQEQPSGELQGAPAGAVAAVGVEGTSGEELWYAQPVENGYQLVDSTPRVRMKLLKTAQEDTFIATVGDAPMGMVYKKDGQWWHEFFKDGKTEVRPLKIKF